MALAAASPSDLPGATPAPPLSPSLASKFRGAVIADLDLPPALSTTPSTPLQTALEMSYDRDYTYLTVVSSQTKKLLGYLDVPSVREKLQQLPAAEADKLRVRDMMTRFRREAERGYEVLTPETELEKLLDFFLDKEKGGFAVVTDEGRRWVVAVATPEDLSRFVSRRPD